VSSLWLATLQRGVGRASHDVKDALNGVSVNLEVIRSRAARPGTPASAIASFGESAVHQLERLTTLIDAVLTLGRAERTPVDVAVTLRRIVTICAASTQADDAAIRLVDGVSESAITRVTADVVRVALMAPLLELVASDGRAPAAEVTCTLESSGTDIGVRMAADGRRATIPYTLADVLRGGGVRWTEGNDLSLNFPRA
jgi:signal transduction histidine kinase